MSKTSLLNQLNKAVDSSLLAYFRIAFGITMIVEMTRYLSFGWVRKYWITPDFNFTFELFGFLKALPGDGMIYLFVAMGVAAFFVAIGFMYRLSILFFFLGFSYVFLLDKSYYLNHFYMVVLVSGILVCLPANRKYSVDALLFPNIQSDWVPNWTVWLLRFQIGVVYLFGGIAKLNSDWLQGEPMRKWLAVRTDFPLIGQWFTEEWMVKVFTFGGLFLDLLAWPLLVFKRTRIFAFVIIVCFHLTNAQLFSIGIFPWMMIFITAIFFDEKYFNLSYWKKEATYIQPPDKPFKVPTWTYALLGVYVLFQVLFPFRHHLYPGNVNWTEEGHRFAWHMKLRTKSSKLSLRIQDKNTGEKYKFSYKGRLNKRQYRKMKTHPDMLRQYAHYIADEMAKEGKDVTVKAKVRTTLNTRDYQLLIDSNVVLSEIPYTWRHKDWIIPLHTPLVVKKQEVLEIDP